MQRKVLVIAVALAIALVACAVMAKTVTVKVKETKVRKDPKFYALVIATVSQGNKLETIEEKDAWLKVGLASGAEGWLHESAVEVKRFDLTGGTGVSSEEATEDEVALAGKGFNEEVEREYRQERPELDYSAVDQLTKVAVSPASMERFLREGRLGEFGGGR